VFVRRAANRWAQQLSTRRSQGISRPLRFQYRADIGCRSPVHVSAMKPKLRSSISGCQGPLSPTDPALGARLMGSARQRDQDQLAQLMDIRAPHPRPHRYRRTNQAHSCSPIPASRLVGGRSGRRQAGFQFSGTAENRQPSQWNSNSGAVRAGTNHRQIANGPAFRT